MIDYLAHRNSAVGSSNLQSMQTNKLMNNLKDATITTLSIHNAIDTRRLPEEIRIKHNAVSQGLRSLIELLDNELRASEPTT
jgi:hypothetical protein